MIIELDINGAKLIVSGENLSISLTEDYVQRRSSTVRRKTPDEHALTRYRANNELTLEVFGALVGVNKSVVYRWENGGIPRKRFIKKIQEVTGGKVAAADWYQSVGGSAQ